MKHLMKFLLLGALVMIPSLKARAEAEAPCDIRYGESIGVRVIEFVSGNVIHSKIPFSEMSSVALREEMLALQDMGLCGPEIPRGRCVLKYEKRKSGNQISFVRNSEHWVSWGIKGKNSAEAFVQILKSSGLCQ